MMCLAAPADHPSAPDDIGRSAALGQRVE